MSTKRLPASAWRPMTNDEREMAVALGDVTFVPGIGTKRFARDIATRASEDGAVITAAQAKYLREVVYRFRRQIPDRIVAMAITAGAIDAPSPGEHPV